MTTNATLLEAIVRLAERAGECILEVYRGDFAVERKADDSPVTIADRQAEAIILPELRRLTSDIPIVSEEAVAAGDRPTIGRRFWLVDPLDGTKEFVERIDEFTVNIALVEDGTPRLGVVHNPVTGESYAATEAGTATRRQKGGVPKPIAARKPSPDGLVALISRFHADQAKLEAFFQQHPALRGQRIKKRRTAGSALKFGLIAAGEADLYPRFGPTMEWDTAAGHAVVCAAGGAVETLDGKPLRYGKPGFLNPDFIVRGR